MDADKMALEMKAQTVDGALYNLICRLNSGPFEAGEVRAELVRIRALQSQPGGGVPLALWCPKCSAPHVDEGEWATRPHKTHQCQSCGHEWRPFDYPTTGVPQLKPGGMVLVPREPTPEQVAAMAECFDPTWGYPDASIGLEWAQKSYAAMIAAAQKKEGGE